MHHNVAYRELQIAIPFFTLKIEANGLLPVSVLPTKSVLKSAAEYEKWGGLDQDDMLHEGMHEGPADHEFDDEDEGDKEQESEEDDEKEPAPEPAAARGRKSLAKQVHDFEAFAFCDALIGVPGAGSS